MPANFDHGFCVRQPSWHGEETLLDEHPENWDAARIAAGLMWEPRVAPTYHQRLVAADEHNLLVTADVGAIPVDVPHPDDRSDRKYRIMVPILGQQTVERDDTGEALTVTTDSYTLISHGDMGEILDAVMGADANVKFETAGSLNGGRQVWALVRLDEPFQVPGDDSDSYPFLALLNAHDRSASCQVTYTTVRVVCWNTFSAADRQAEKTGARHVFRHTGDVQQRIRDAKDALGNLRTQSAATQKMFAEMATTPIRDDQVMTFAEQFLPSPRENGELCSDRVHQNVLDARAKFHDIYATGITTEGIRGNAYGLFMTATEWLDHVRGFQNRSTYLGRTVLKPQAARGAALDLIREVVAA